MFGFQEEDFRKQRMTPIVECMCRPTENEFLVCHAVFEGNISKYSCEGFRFYQKNICNYCIISVQLVSVDCCMNLDRQFT